MNFHRKHSHSIALTVNEMQRSAISLLICVVVFTSIYASAAYAANETQATVVVSVATNIDDVEAEFELEMGRKLFSIVPGEVATDNDVRTDVYAITLMRQPGFELMDVICIDEEKDRISADIDFDVQSISFAPRDQIYCTFQIDVRSGANSLAPSDAAIQISNLYSGEVCSDESGPSHVCVRGPRIRITAKEECDWTATIQYPCTRIGYQFDYSGADPDELIYCDVKRARQTTFSPSTDVTGPGTAQYTIELAAASGHHFHHGYNTYAPVTERITVVSLHTCSYAGEVLYTVEHLMYYEPE